MVTSMAARKSDDVEELSSPFLRAMLSRLRIEMLSCAVAFQEGPLHDEFWKLVDDLNAIRDDQQLRAELSKPSASDLPR